MELPSEHLVDMEVAKKLPSDIMHQSKYINGNKVKLVTIIKCN